MCHAKWLMTLAYIFKVIPWLCNETAEIWHIQFTYVVCNDSWPWHIFKVIEPWLFNKYHISLQVILLEIGFKSSNSSILHEALGIISKPSVNSNWSCSPGTPNSGQNWWFFPLVTLKFDGWPWKTIGYIYTTSSFVHHCITIGEFKLELQSGNA